MTVGRAFTYTFAGIAPGLLLGFIGMRVIGGMVGLAFVALIFIPGRKAAE